MIHPEKIIVHRVIHAVRANECEAHRGNPEVIQEYGMVRAASDSRVGELGIRNGVRFVKFELSRGFRRRRATCQTEQAASGSLRRAAVRANRRRRPGNPFRSRFIHVEVGDSFLFQFVSVLLAPFSGTRKRVFLAVPTADDKRAPRPDALL